MGQTKKKDFYFLKTLNYSYGKLEIFFFCFVMVSNKKKLIK